jgi:Flp pilus assembly CpaE family ATPase
MDYTQFLRSVDILRRLPDEQLARLAGRLRMRRFSAGQIIFRRGDPSEAMYLVFEGRVETLTTDTLGQERVLAFQAEGSFFGEMALLAQQPYTVEARAVTDTTLLELRCEEFNDWLESNPLVARELLRLLAERQAPTRTEALQPADNAETRAAGQGQVVTVFSSRGGSGKTTLAVNLAAALAQLQPERVVLLDLGLTFNHAALLLDLQPRSSLAGVGVEALAEFDRESLGRYVVPHSSTVRLLPGSLRPEDGERLSHEHVKLILGLLRRFFAYVVVDTGANFMDPTLAALEEADHILYMLTPELTALHDVVECQRIFADVLHIPADRVCYLLNHLYPVSALSRDQVETAFQRPVDGALPYGGDTPMQAQARGEPFVVCQPSAPIARAVSRLARQLAGAPATERMNGEQADEAKRGGLLGFLTGR